MYLPLLLLLTACDGKTSDTQVVPRAEIIPEPPPARMWRLTEHQYRNAVLDLTGVSFEGELPIDYDLHGYTNVGAAEVTIAPYDLELYENAAWDIAEQLLPDLTALENETTCPLSPNTIQMLDAQQPTVNMDCVEQWISIRGAGFWQRPLNTDEVDSLVTLFTSLTEQTNPLLAAQAVISALLLSPNFVFITEIGEIDNDGNIRLTALELAKRLSYFLTNSPPDEQLLAAAQDGSLHQADVLEFQAIRLLQSPKAQQALLDFFRQTLDTERITTIDKNADLFPKDSEELRRGMILELEHLFWSAVESGDFRDLLTSDYAYVTPDLATLYGLDVDNDSLQMLPASQQRGGLLGRAGFLALQSTAVRSSPTHRGKFIRTRLLCQEVPPPPEGVVASLDGIDPTLTLREQLEQHMTDPACSSCHELIDPIGFPLENYDALGQWRSQDNGHNIDASGSLDGVQIDGAAQLALAVSEHQRFGYCVTAQLLRHSTRNLEGSLQEGYISDLSDSFAAGGYNFRELVVSMILSDPFRLISGTLQGDSCNTNGEERSCNSDCGEGVEQCIDGVWQGCNAPPVSIELCDDIDNDCDGVIDNIVQDCEYTDTVGIQECDSGYWGECSVLQTAETCDGIDNDGNGSIDDAMTIDIASVSFADLQFWHSDCDPLTDGVSGPCNAAVNRFCANRGCSMSTGYGPLALDIVNEQASVVCLHSDQAHNSNVSYETLGIYLEYCSENDPVSANCNASIHRYCKDIGLTTGFGPLEHSDGTATVACTPNASVNQVSYDELTVLQNLCYWPEERNSEACRTAMHQWCTSQGHQTGFGPLENYQNDAWIACIPTMETE